MQPAGVVPEGDPAAKRFAPSANGRKPCASLRIAQILGRFKTSNGQWQHATRDSLELKLAMLSRYPARHFHITKQRGQISSGWKASARVTPQAGDAGPALELAEANAAAFGVDR
eukprot:4621719-Pyramimonas_sp.AAC.1